jgi:hypothetical protein
MVETENVSDHPHILPVWDFMARSRVNVTLYFSIPQFSGGGWGVVLFQTPKESENQRIIDLLSKNFLVYIEIGEYYGILVILICVLC